MKTSTTMMILSALISASAQAEGMRVSREYLVKQLDRPSSNKAAPNNLDLTNKTVVAANNKEKDVNLMMELSMNGEVVARPKVTVALGHEATVTQTSETGDSYEIRVTPTVENPSEEAVLMKFVVSKTENDFKREIAKPQIITQFGNPATISQESADSKLELKVIPLRAR